MEDKKPNNLTGAMNSNDKYQSAPKIDQEKAAAEFEKIKTKLDGLKKSIAKKYPYLIALALLPGNACAMFEEDEQLPKEVTDTKPLHVMMLIPEEHYKDIPKIKPEIVKMVRDAKENLWFHIKTPVDLWNYGLDSKFEFIDAIGAAFPFYDTGLLGALRVASIHKTLVLRKFEKYVASYVIAGSLVRGTAGKDSDVDVFIVIDDTDVKRMPRMELLEKLRGIIHDYIREATALSGVKNPLNVQVYLLTDFWMSVKDAHPVMFTFIRDGIPLYDRGTFIPWKLLLQMGKIKPSQEAIDLYMKEGDRTDEIVKRRLLDCMVDIYYGVVTPTQAMMMLAGHAPPVPKTLPEETKKVLVQQEKVMSEKDIKILEKAVHLFKQYEYGKLKEFSGKETDEFLKECQNYNKNLKSIRKKIEKKLLDKTAQDLYKEMFNLLKSLLGNKSDSSLIKEVEEHLIAKGKLSPRFRGVLKELTALEKKIGSGKVDPKEVDRVKRDAVELMESLTEYGQRTDLIKTEKGFLQIQYNGRKAGLVLLGNETFIIENNMVKKIHSGKLVDVKKEDFEKALKENEGRMQMKISTELFAMLEKVLGKFEILL